MDYFLDYKIKIFMKNLFKVLVEKLVIMMLFFYSIVNI